MLKRMFKKRKGFTLTELIVVVTILGILTAVAVPLVSTYIGDSKTKADNANAKIIEGVIKRNDAKGTITLASTSGEDIGTAVEGELGNLPIPQQADFEFYVNRTTGEVRAVADNPGGWVLIE